MPNLCVLCDVETTGSYGCRPLCFEHYKKGENLDNLPDTWQPKELVMNEIFSLKAFQAEQREWSLRNFGESYGTGYRALLGAGEEMGELFHSHLKAEQGIRCLLYTSDAADDLLCVDLGGRRIIKKKK